MAVTTRRSGTLAIASRADSTSGSGGAEAGCEQQPDKPNDKPDERPTRPPLKPLRLVGQAMVWIGGLLLLFALFQLWGTGLLEWRAQRGLDAEFDQLMAEVRVDAAEPSAAPATAAEAEPRGQLDVTNGLEHANADLPDAGAMAAPAMPTTAASPTASPAPAAGPPEAELVAVAPDSNVLPPEGAPIARIDIPAIGVRKTIVQGIERQTLRAGPGHYPTTPMPGQPGNAAIAGHRTTHGSPFLDIDRLQPGDHIDVETIDGLYRYEVEAHRSADGSERGHFIVDPSEVGVITDQGDDRLTLTACHPRYSARQRIIVTALLVGEPSPEPAVVPIP
ncbi:MAG: class E sortase, partial [Acidimicrobiales bacterium]